MLKKIRTVWLSEKQKKYLHRGSDAVIVDYKDDATALTGERNDRRKRRDQQPYDELCIPGFGKRRSSDTLCRRTQR